ncbi:hypothetical protein GBF38_019117 [Nibea albiflora]|uniref:Uncharacterized protein n=1 Tax=Nibea albiflora TaxID=240163 RepID=A0ACB7F123_NIBAL|nr:hypothetical protein GBF38_019117 [Nibea albiflora]
MLRPLPVLLAVIAAGAARSNKMFDISSRPVTFYGQTYKQVYLDLTGDNVTICFNTGPGQDCIVGPLASLVQSRFEIRPYSESTEKLIRRLAPTIKRNLKGSVSFDYIFGASTLMLHDFGTQAALYVFIDIDDRNASYAFDAVVNGTVVDTFTFTEDSYGNINGATDISGCRRSGVVYKPGTVISRDPETFSDLICNEFAVIETRLIESELVRAEDRQTF